MPSITVTSHTVTTPAGVPTLTIFFTVVDVTPTSYSFTLTNIGNPSNSLSYNNVPSNSVTELPGVGNYSIQFTSDGTNSFDPAASYNVVLITFISGVQNVNTEYSITPGGGGGGGGGGAVCFLGNAPVLTPSGYKRIDSLAVGDMVRTADGRDVAIQRVKHQRILAPSVSVNPYVIPKGQFGATENLAISPRHAVAVPGRGMVEARELGLRQLPMKAAFDYYNLELPEWDNMVVAGVEVESLAPKKRVVMTAAQFRALIGGKTVDLAKLARFASVRDDGTVDVTLTCKSRRI